MKYRIESEHNESLGGIGMADFPVLQAGQHIKATSGSITITGVVTEAEFSNALALRGATGRPTIAISWLQQMGFHVSIAEVESKQRGKVLTDDEVRELRGSSLPAKDLARIFGVTRSTVYQIQNRLRRSDVI